MRPAPAPSVRRWRCVLPMQEGLVCLWYVCICVESLSLSLSLSSLSLLSLSLSHSLSLTHSLHTHTHTHTHTPHESSLPSVRRRRCVRVATGRRLRGMQSAKAAGPGPGPGASRHGGADHPMQTEELGREGGGGAGGDLPSSSAPAGGSCLKPAPRAGDGLAECRGRRRLRNAARSWPDQGPVTA